MRFVIKHALGGSSKLCFLPWQGAHFQETDEKKKRESEKCSQNTFDGKCDTYTSGLGGAEKRKC